MNISVESVQPVHARQTIALLDELRMSMFGVMSPSLYRALVDDGMDGRIDCRVAVRAGRVDGVVLAAPKHYWRSLLMTHWPLALHCAASRLTQGRSHSMGGLGRTRSGQTAPEAPAPAVTWDDPGPAWRIVFVGTRPSARGLGIGSLLYRSVMADRSLVACIGAENEASIALHRSLGWQLYPGGDAVLAVYLRPSAIQETDERPAAARPEDAPRDRGSDRRAPELRFGRS